MEPLATLLSPHEQLSHSGSAGRAVLNVETRVVDDDVPEPAGTVGEVVHRSPHSGLCYYRDPEQAAEAFRGSQFHSGDLGAMNAKGDTCGRRPQKGHDQDGW